MKCRLLSHFWRWWVHQYSKDFRFAAPRVGAGTTGRDFGCLGDNCLLRMPAYGP
jgi:hypothetical protein